uniref:Uncharacterized protein n=1 Tax=Acanthochromis polyacanthus TaxID=80966 RepID=A0A3Q1G7X8_9TELE
MTHFKSLWNWGSITCIMCFTWLVSHLSINSSRANSLSGPLHIWRCPKIIKKFYKTTQMKRGLQENGHVENCLQFSPQLYVSEMTQFLTKKTKTSPK